MLSFSHRILEPELMDSAPLTRDELAPVLHFLALVHRYAGGERVLFEFLKEWSPHWPKDRVITVLDVGTGGADIPLSLVRWGKRHGFQFQITAIDIMPVIVAIARENTASYPEIRVLESDFFSFAQRGEQFDLVISSLFLHHMPDEKLVELLALCDAMAKRGVIMSDLSRSRKAYWSVGVLTTLFGNKVARHDGLLSVRRALTVGELDVLTKNARLTHLETRQHPFFRLSLSTEKRP